MINLLKFEFRKLFQMKTLYIFIGIFLGVILLAAGVFKMMEVVDSMLSNMSSDGTGIIPDGLGSIYDGKFFLLNALYNSEITLLLAVFVSILFCSDYSQGTVKNIISKGYSRIKLFWAKLAAVAVASVIFTIVCWIYGFLIGWAFWGKLGSDWNINVVYSLLAQLLTVIAFAAMFSFVATTIKKLAGVMAIGIAVPMIMEMVVMLINLLIDSDKFNLTEYWLGQNFLTLSSAGNETEVITKALIVAVSYFVVFAGLGTLVSRKSDV